MSVSYIQISKTKGEGILELLESTLAACKERGMGTNTPTNACGKKQQFDFSGARQPASVSKTLTLTPKECVFLLSRYISLVLVVLNPCVAFYYFTD
jgi:hypothetical protein